MPAPEERCNAKGELTWRVRFRLDGKQRSRTFYDLQAAQRFCDWVDAFGPARAVELDDLEAEREGRGNVEPTAPTLDVWAERYIASLTGASPSTKDGYRSTYKHSFGALIGDLRLDQIDRETVATAVAKLTTRGGRGGRGYSDKSIRNQHGLLSAMLGTAVIDRIIDANPCDHIRLPRRTEHETIEKRFLTEDEFWAIWSNITDHYRPLLEFLVGTGARWGEAEALEVRDVDLKRLTVRIERAAKTENGQRVVGPVKTRKSRRTIPVDPELAETLRPLIAERRPGDRVFTGRLGGRLQHKVFWQDVWCKAIERAGLPNRPRIHDLRHTHASWLIAEGVKMKTVQERLGHESLKTTMDLYAHLLPGDDVAAAAAMERVWARRQRPQLSVVG
ncbi:site-specific integrase [uncultured Aeromicrobium sp.]|uniref:tyrosine-type recombinase/integrase n=1 Tax=uncultured Aeromicrobium sp. TaxID=337820 RepID=UPI0025D25535|nr:site-specific integrase [uncultured Aeromicrobium sp.]